MTTLTKDARYFVEGVTKYLRADHGDAVLPKVTAALHRITASAQRGKTAAVESAAPLNHREKADVSRFLAGLLGHTVRLEYRVNRELLGGFRIVVGDWVVDTSLLYQLHAMTQMLVK